MNLAEQLKRVNVKNLKTKSGQTFGYLLYDEACRLKDCIQHRLNVYMNSYKPKIYERTGAFQNSLKVEDAANIKAEGNTLVISVYFDESGYHKSGDGLKQWDGNGKTVNTAYLLNYGYEVKKDVWFKGKPYFGFRPAANFIEDGRDDFLSRNPYNIRVEIRKPSKVVW